MFGRLGQANNLAHLKTDILYIFTAWDKVSEIFCGRMHL
jgi:hypothetical protein